MKPLICGVPLAYEICEHSETFLIAFECCENRTEKEFKMMVMVKGLFHGKNWKTG